MKKILLILLLSIYISPTAFAQAVANDTGGHSTGTQNTVIENDKNSSEMIDKVKSAMTMNVILGGPQAWLAAGSSIVLPIAVNAISDAVSEAFSGDETGAKNSDGALPEGKDMATIHDEKFKRNTNPQEAGLANKAETSKNVEIATTETTTFSYAYGLANRTIASRVIGDDTSSASKEASKKATSAGSLGSAISASTATANENAQTFNRILEATALANMQRALAIVEQNSATNSILDASLMGSMGGGASGILGSMF